MTASTYRPRPGAPAPKITGRASVCVVVPTVNEVGTIAPICQALVALRDEGVCDRVLVVDESTDATAALARAAGADVLRQSDLQPHVGAVLGKGDAMWRALGACEEDIIVFVDGDTRGFGSQVVRDLILAIDRDGAAFAKATYRRPWDDGGVVARTGGGRVTELAAKPLLRRFFPDLGHFGQPLAGEIAARTDLLRQLPFVTGYGVDVALLIDAWRVVGSEGLSEVEAGPRQNRHRPLEELVGTADAVIAAILDRAGLGELQNAIAERPALTGRHALPSRGAAPSVDR